MDPLMLYAISLHKYANDITEMIRVAELAIELDLIPPKDVIPPLPEIPQVSCRHVGNNLNYIPKQFTLVYILPNITKNLEVCASAPYDENNYFTILHVRFQAYRK